MEIEIVHFPVTPPLNSATLTSAKRARFPARYIRKDSRTLALRLAYGPQSNKTNAVIERAGLVAEKNRDFSAERQTLDDTLPLTGYHPVRCQQILEAFHRLRGLRTS